MNCVVQSPSIPSAQKAPTTWPLFVMGTVYIITKLPSAAQLTRPIQPIRPVPDHMIPVAMFMLEPSVYQVKPEHQLRLSPDTAQAFIFRLENWFLCLVHTGTRRVDCLQGGKLMEICSPNLSRFFRLHY